MMLDTHREAAIDKAFLCVLWPNRSLPEPVTSLAHVINVPAVFV